MSMQTDDIDLLATPRIAPGLEIQAAAGEQLVHDAATGRIHVLNAAAGRVLARFDGTTSLAQIVEDLVTTTGVDADRAARDVVRVCADFRDQGLIR
jgi:hypothetical protein